MNARLAKLNRAQDEQQYLAIRSQLISAEIRRQYTIDDEIAILRQRDSKPEEYAAYNAYAEACKTKIKDSLGED